MAVNLGDSGVVRVREVGTGSLVVSSFRGAEEFSRDCYGAIGTDHEVERDKGKEVAAVAVASGDVAVKRGLCSVCGFVVKLHGHQDRCKPNSGIGVHIKELAWIGDAAWTLYVRINSLGLSRGRTQVLRYVTNEVLASVIDTVVDVVDLGSKVSQYSSLRTKANYVEAAYAVSVRCRFVVAQMFAEFDGRLDALWQPIVRLDLRSSAVVLPQPAIDGYCYLALVPNVQWDSVSQLLGPYPKWSEVRQQVSCQDSLVFWIWLEFDRCHISLSPLPGAVRYQGTLADFELGADMRVGGMARVDLTRRLDSRVMPLGWQPAVVALYEEFLGGIRRFRSDGRSVMTTQRNWDQLQGLFVVPEGIGHHVATAALARACNAMLAALQLQHVDTTYIATSGVITVVSQGEASRIDPVDVIV